MHSPRETGAGTVCRTASAAGQGSGPPRHVAGGRRRGGVVAVVEIAVWQPHRLPARVLGAAPAKPVHREGLVDPGHYEVFLLLYVATRQAIDHIEYWSERFTSERGYKPLQLRVLFVIEREVCVHNDAAIKAILENEKYCDWKAADDHFRVGGTDDPRTGFANCALPVVLSHNTPNNSIYILWGPENYEFFGLFPRVSRHREF